MMPQPTACGFAPALHAGEGDQTNYVPFPSTPSNGNVTFYAPHVMMVPLSQPAPMCPQSAARCPIPSGPQPSVFSVVQPTGLVTYLAASPSFEPHAEGYSPSSGALSESQKAGYSFSVSPSSLSMGVSPTLSMGVSPSSVSIGHFNMNNNSNFIFSAVNTPNVSFSFSPSQLPLDTRGSRHGSVAHAGKKGDVHTALRSLLRYVLYTKGSVSTPVTEREGDFAGVPAISVFIQMFPCEFRDRVEVLNCIIREVTSPEEPALGVVENVLPRSETSFIALIRTKDVWNLIQKLRCRVLMDRNGFWYAETMEQYLEMKKYCEGIRHMPQQARHVKTDGLPCMPLVVELSTSEVRSAIKAPAAPPCFDDIAPIQAVERRRPKKSM